MLKAVKNRSNFKLCTKLSNKEVLLCLCFFTHFRSIFHFNTVWKHQKISSFQMFSRGIEREHWPKMVNIQSSSLFISDFERVILVKMARVVPYATFWKTPLSSSQNGIIRFFCFFLRNTSLRNRLKMPKS